MQIKKILQKPNGSSLRASPVTHIVITQLSLKSPAERKGEEGSGFL